MKALITGVSGFVGAHLAEHLLACGDQVAGCARRQGWSADAPVALRENCQVISWDVAAPADAGALAELLDFAPDWVFHLAAISAPADCGLSDPSPAAVTVNVEGTRRVLEWAASLPARPRLVLASSCKVYAPVDPGDPQVAEDAPVLPVSGYGKTKQAAEQLALVAGERYDLECIIVRAFQHTGPRQTPRFMLAHWASQIALGDDEPIQAQCLNSRLDIADVRDVVRAYRLLACSGAAGRIYNVGSGVQRRSGDILDRLLALAGGQRTVVENSPEKQQHPIADISRISAEIGWRPTIDLDTTLQDTLEYWRREARK